MKKTNSVFKRITSLVLSLVFAISSFAVVGFSNTTAEVAKADAQEYFLMSYFTGNSDCTKTSGFNQATRFALSTDGVNFRTINNGDPTIVQTGGSKNVRDEFIFQGADGYYYLIGTDLNVPTMGWWGNQPQMVIWRSSDLVNWDHETYINVAQICGLRNDQVYRTWAPEVFYDDVLGKYMVYFAFAAEGYSSTRMHYMLTDDLLDQSHYSAPQILYDPGYDDIDSDIIKQGDTYYMFYKDETPGRSSVCLATASAVTGPYTFVGQFNTGGETGGIEGCEVYTVGNNYYLVADRYGAVGRFAIYNLGSSLAAVAAASDGTNISVSDGNPISTVDGMNGFQNLGARHGSIIHISEAQYNALISKYGISTDDDITYNFDRAYCAENSWHYDTVHDSSGYALDFMTNASQYSYILPHLKTASLHNSTMFVNDEAVENIFQNNKKWSVSFEATVDEIHGTPLFALTSGPSPSGSTDWIRFLDNGKLVLYYGGEYHEVGSTSVTTSVNYKFDITYDQSKIIVYKDGKEEFRYSFNSINFDRTQSTAYVAFGWTDTINVSGLWGSYRNLRIRSRAITSGEVALEYNGDIDSHLIYQYNEGTDNVDGRNNVTYNGGGFNTTYSGENAQSYTISSWVNIGAQKQTGNNDANRAMLFEFGTGGTGDNKNYMGMTEDGRWRFCWSSGSTPHYVDIDTGYNFAVNTWYFLQVNIVPEGSIQHFKIWINGESVADQFAGYNAMSCFVGDPLALDMGVYEHSPNYMLSQDSFDLNFGVGHAYWPVQGYNLIDDFRVYSKAVEPSVLYAENAYSDLIPAEISALRTLVSNYESSVNSNTVKKNLGAAYTRYVEANRVLDAYDYGDLHPGEAYTQIVTAKNNLSTAIGNISDWSRQYAPDRNQVFSGDSSYDNGYDLYKNLIYAETNYGNSVRADTWGSGDSYAKSRLYYPDATMLYDGVTAPTLAMIINPYCDRSTSNSSKSCKRYALTCFNTNSNLELGYGKWGGQIGGNYDATWGATRGGTKINASSSQSDYNSSDTLRVRNGRSNENGHDGRWYANYVRYTGNMSNNSLTHETITPTFTIYYNSSTTWATGDAENNYITANTDLHVINYKRYLDAIANSTAYTTEVKKVGSTHNYREGGAQTYLTAYDTLTGYNLYDYFTDGSKNDWSGAVTGMSTAINAMSDKSLTADGSEFTNLKNLLVDLRDEYSSSDETLNNTYTKTSIKVFKAAYKAAQNQMAALLSNSYSSRRTQAVEAYNLLNSALDPLADLTEFDTAFDRADEFLTELEGKEAQYTASSVQALIDAMNAGSTQTYAKADATARKDYGQAVQTAANGYKNAINTAYDGIVEHTASVDTTAYVPAHNKIVHLDIDAYEENEGGSIATAISVADELVTTSTTTYDGATINVVDNKVTQQNVEDATTRILTALSTCVKKYKIYATGADISVSGNEGTYFSATPSEIDTETALGEGHEGYKGKGTYGVRLTFDSNNANTAWYMSYDSASTGRSEQYLGYGESVQTGVQGNMHVRAVKKSNDAPNLITISRNYSDNSSTHGIQLRTYAGSTYTLPEAPAIAYYEFQNYTYNGNTYDAGDVISGINKNTVIQANYLKAVDNAYTVKVSSSNGNGDIYNASASYNKKIEGTDASAYGWVKVDGGKETMFYVGKDLTYFVTDSIELKAVTSKPAGYTGEPVAYLRECGLVKTTLTDGSGKTKLTINGSYVSDGFEIVEYGVLLGKATTGTITDEDVIVENSSNSDGFKVLRAKATKTVGANQFTISVNVPSSFGAFKYRAYVMYKKEGQITTAYSDVVNDSF